MELMFYEDAAKALGVSVGTLAHAVSRGELTRAGIQGNRRQLIKEQVLLFTGINPRTGHKKRISYNALSTEEQALWQRYADEATHAPGTPALAIDKETVNNIVDESVQKNFIVLMEAISTLLKGEVPQGTFFTKHPFLAGITYSLLVTASIAAAAILFNQMDEQGQREAIAYVEMLDATLQAQEQMPEPPISIEEIRARRERIAQFKREIAAAA